MWRRRRLEGIRSSWTPRGLGQGFHSLRLLDFSLKLFQTIAGPADQKREAGKGQPINEQYVEHSRIDRSTTADDRLRMLGAEKPDREVNKRDAQSAEN